MQIAVHDEKLATTFFPRRITPSSRYLFDADKTQ